MTDTKKKDAFTTKELVFCAMFTALGVILSRLIIPMPNETTRFTLGSMPIFLAGALFGPLAGAVTGFASDFIGCLFSGYGYNPIFALPPILYGITAGLFRPALVRATGYGKRPEDGRKSGADTEGAAAAPGKETDEGAAAAPGKETAEGAAAAPGKRTAAGSRKNASLIRTLILAYLIPVFLGSVVYQSFAQALIYGAPDARMAYFTTKVISRGIQFAVTMAVEVVLTALLFRYKVFRQLGVWPPTNKQA